MSNAPTESEMAKVKSSVNVRLGTLLWQLMVTVQPKASKAPGHPLIAMLCLSEDQAWHIVVTAHQCR